MLSVHPSPPLSPSHTHTHTHTQTYTQTHSCYTPLMTYLFLFHFETRLEDVFKAFSLWQSVHFICSVVSDCVQLQGLQHTMIPCPSPTPRACWNSSPLNPRSHPLLSPSPWHLFLPSIRIFSNETVLCIRWTKYWSCSFSVSPSRE